MEPIDIQAAVRSLAELVRQHYLFGDRAEQLARKVEDWGTGEIAALQSAEELATGLTDLLQEATSDGHFKVMPRVFSAEEHAAAPEDRWKHSMPGAASNFGFRSVEVVDGTALITLTSLDYIKWSGPTAVATMQFARHAERVLIDVRGCRGGDPELIGLLAGYFMGTSPVELSTVHWRDGTVETLWSDPDGAAFHFGPEVALVVIVGPATASGGEALADHLQAPGRALVVGQRSAGGAHRIKEFQLHDGHTTKADLGKVLGLRHRIDNAIRLARVHGPPKRRHCSFDMLERRRVVGQCEHPIEDHGIEAGHDRPPYWSAARGSLRIRGKRRADEPAGQCLPRTGRKSERLAQAELDLAAALSRLG